MEKKWWFLVAVFLIMAIAIFSTALFLDKKPVKRLQGGIIIMQGDFGGGTGSGAGSSGSSGSSTGTESGDPPAPDETQEQQPPNFAMPSEPACWECPLGGLIINVSPEDLTDFMVQNLTNCTNVSQLIQIDCPPVGNQTSAICGDGVCNGNENPENCPQDCVRFSPEDKIEEKSGEIIIYERVAEKPAVEFYYALNFKGECIKLRKVAGNEPDECDPKNPSVILSGKVTQSEPSLSPVQKSFLGCLIRILFGFPGC